MAENKVKKMAQAFDPASGTLTHTFGGDAASAVAVKLADYPQNVVDYFTLLGMRTAHRNATIGSEDEGSVGTPEGMAKRLVAKIEQWKAGVLRLAAAGEERAPTSTLLVEAYGIAKRMQAAMAAGDDVDNWEAYDAPDAAELRAALEEKASIVTNPDAVAAARAKAVEAGEDGDEAASKAEVTQLDVIKATNLFKLATSAAKANREAAKKAALKAALKAEAV